MTTNATTTDNLPTVLTLDETARFLRVSKATASNLARGKVHGVKPLPVVRVGRRVIVRRDSLLDWLSRQDQGSVVR